ncbi:MAG: Asp23/Gls24 family envelope stress response protein [Clostridia bacterium]|nr:Asp23/Gls24 family envelope stress response protein [Clostridia bacterium]MBT7123291.1 Asp23/Gls24 family envelope stress response protein [Clostridia bacterium]
MSTNNINTREEQHGNVSFANDVVATIAGLATVEIEGVAGMSGGFSGGLAELLGRKNLTKGVKVEVGKEECAIDLYVVVDYGSDIPAMCKKIQANVKKAVETMTGLRVIETNVHIQGVHIDKEKKEEDKRVH